ncbi:hypothetical protein BC941DRAFT_449074 [Chlamydoabsidia padenii]|nr:hypothetical protein BC941DRAFT_449074 [Chlamydoabsidia padenii]
MTYFIDNTFSLISYKTCLLTIADLFRTVDYFTPIFDRGWTSLPGSTNNSAKYWIVALVAFPQVMYWTQHYMITFLKECDSWHWSYTNLGVSLTTVGNLYDGSSHRLDSYPPSHQKKRTELIFYGSELHMQMDVDNVDLARVIEGLQLAGAICYGAWLNKNMVGVAS